MKGNRSFTTNKARKQEENKRQKKGTDEQTIKASVGQKRDRETESLWGGNLGFH
jgi:hypothetical protein